MEGFLDRKNNASPTSVSHLHTTVIAPDTPSILLPSHSSQSLLLRTTITPSKETINTLIDSGATDNFIDKAWAALAPGTSRRLPIPICLRLFNGNASSMGDITHFVHLPITFANGQQQELRLLVTKLHASALLILRLPWLQMLMADSLEQPPGFLEPLGGSTSHETLSASKYQPPPKRDDRLTHNMSKSFGMPGRLSMSWMKAILNPGAKPGDKSFASGLSLPATNLPSLIYLTLPEDTTFTSGALGKPVRYADTTQGSAIVHSTPFRTAQPEHGAKPGPELLSHRTTQYQRDSPVSGAGHGNLDKGKAPAAPSVVDEQVESGREPPSGYKGPREVRGQEPELDSSDEEEDTRSLST
ncbi:hypothetical protein C0992_009359, partial [Termitomyces sp. T32_za158]